MKCPPWYVAAMLSLMIAGCLAPKQKDRPPTDFVDHKDEKTEGVGSAVSFSMDAEQLASIAKWLGNRNTLSIEKAVHIEEKNITLDAKAGTRFSYEMNDQSGLFTFDQPLPTIKAGFAKLIGGVALKTIKINSDGSGVAGTQSFGKYRFRWCDDVASMSSDKPEVWMYSAAGCLACEVAKKELSDESLPFTLIVKEKAPEWVKTYPTFHWSVSEKDWRQRDRYDGKERFVEMWKKSREQSKASAATRPFVRHDRASIGSRSEAKWSINGDFKPSRSTLLEHLSRDGIHKGKHDRKWLETLTPEQLRWVHDRDHGET